MDNKALPDKFAYYSTIDKYCFDLLLKHRFVVTDPTKGFNDPLDCYFDVNFSDWNKERLVTQLRGAFISEQKNNAGDFTPETHEMISNKTNELNSFHEAVLRQKLSTHARKIIRGFLSKSLRVRCFSALDEKKILNNVMFSHYGDSHKGLCYIFDREKLIPEGDRDHWTEVRYFPNPFSLNYSGSGIYSQDELDRIGRGILGIKHQDWKYENEWRLKTEPTCPNKIHETMGFQPDALEGIVLGLNTTDEDEERIVSIVEKTTRNVIIFKAKRVFGSFELKYENNPILK